MKNCNHRSATQDILKDEEINCTLLQRIELIKKKKGKINQYDLKIQRANQSHQYTGLDLEKICSSDLENYPEIGTTKVKTHFKLPVISKVRSKSTQMKTYSNRNQQSEDDSQVDLRTAKQGNTNLQPIFKQIHQILRKHKRVPQGNCDSRKQHLENDNSILKLSELINNQNSYDTDIGKFVQQKIEDKRIQYFFNQYENTIKYDEEEDSLIHELSTNQLSQISNLRRRKKVILSLAQKKSPKFLYPLGPKIRVPNRDLGNQYFQKSTSPPMRKKEFSVSPKIKPIENSEICVIKLDSPPKERFFPTSSLREDYLDIKVNQILKSMLHCKIYQN